MELNIANIPSEPNSEALKSVFLNNVESKLHIDFDNNEILENDEWIDKVLFTLPYILKALQNANKLLVTEEEILKMELIKKVDIESIKHLTKHTDMVMKFDEENGDVVPERLLNTNKEETHITYENRFLYTLIRIDRRFYLY